MKMARHRQITQLLEPSYEVLNTAIYTFNKLKLQNICDIRKQFTTDVVDVWTEMM